MLRVVSSSLLVCYAAAGFAGSQQIVLLNDPQVQDSASQAVQTRAIAATASDGRTGDRSDSRCVWTVDSLRSGTYDLEYFVNKPEAIGVVDYAIESETGLSTRTATLTGVGGWQPLGRYSFANAGRIMQVDRSSDASGTAASAVRLTLVAAAAASLVDSVPPSVGICTDDWGDEALTSYANAMQPVCPEVTYADMPFFSYTMPIYQLSSTNKCENFVHMPMQAVSDPTGVDNDPTCLFIFLSDAEVLRRFRAALDQAGTYPIGMNNHRGSQFTQYVHGMDIVLQEMKDRGLYVFYDSRTIGTSIAYDEARKMGMLSTKNDLFVDGDTVQQTYDSFMQVAQRSLTAPNVAQCCIGHERPYSVPAFMQIMPVLKTMGIEVRRVSRMSSYVVEQHMQPPGATFTITGDSSITSTDMISEDCFDGNAALLKSTTSGTARFTPNLPMAGNYRVYVGFPVFSNPCDQVKVTVTAASNSQPFILNQQVEQNRWHYIGTYPFNAGTGGSVMLDNSLCSNTTHVIAADAVKFQYDGPQTLAAAQDWALYGTE